jgi:hypothetical protein
MGVGGWGLLAFLYVTLTPLISFSPFFNATGSFVHVHSCAFFLEAKKFFFLIFFF